MQKIDLFGMELVDHSLKEALWITDSFLKNGAPNTILFISAKMLVGAGGSDMQKEWEMKMDICLKELKKANSDAVNRSRIDYGANVLSNYLTDTNKAQKGTGN